VDLENISKEELARQIEEMTAYMDNVVVFWGGKREFRETFEEVALNESGEYTSEEATNAGIIVETAATFDEFIELVRDSFERGGINYVISEKISALMEEVASRRRSG